MKNKFVKLKNIFINFILPIKDKKLAKKTIFSATFVFASLLMLFPISSLKNSIYIEDSANYYSNVTLNYTKSRTYLPLIAECKNSTVSVPDTEFEFYDLYGSFRESRTVFAATANADKKHTVYFDEIGDSNTNYSFLFVERAGFSNKRYKNAWKHEFYPLQLEFKGDHVVREGCFSFVYISEHDADLLLQNPKYQECKTHEDLIGKSVTLTINGIKNTWMISNVYLQTNYFYDSLNDVMGNFFLTYNKFPDGVNKQSLFFLREHSFQNQYFLKYSKLKYSREFYDFKIGTYNINEDYKLNNQKLEQIFFEKNETPFYLLFSFQIIVFVTSLVIIFRLKLHRYPISLTIIFALSSLPYFIFKIVYVSSKYVFLFNSFATQTNLFLIIVLILFVITLLLIDLFKKGLIRNENN